MQLFIRSTRVDYFHKMSVNEYGRKLNVFRMRKFNLASPFLPIFLSQSSIRFINSKSRTFSNLPNVVGYPRFSFAKELRPLLFSCSLISFSPWLYQSHTAKSPFGFAWHLFTLFCESRIRSSKRTSSSVRPQSSVHESLPFFHTANFFEPDLSCMAE